MNHSFNKLLLLGVAAEIIIFLLSYLLYPAIEDTFRYAARYSGRLSLLIYLYAFYQFAISHPTPVVSNTQLRTYIKLFAVLHLIHFGFLASSVYLNAIPLETHKVIGGALAYLMIVVAPLKLHQVKFSFQLVYFYYVGFVMLMTYVARIKGDFEGAEPYWFHYLSLGVLLSCFVLFGIWIKKSGKKMVN